MPVVRTENLTKRFADVTAVDRVTIEVRAGEIFGLIGPNGAGKSTMIKILTTLLPPTAGSAWVAGAEVSRQPAKVRRRIGYVPQAVSADGSLTAYENLWVSARLHNIPRAEQRRRIDEAFDVVGLRDAAHTLVRRCCRSCWSRRPRGRRSWPAKPFGTDLAILAATVTLLVVVAGRMLPRIVI